MWAIHLPKIIYNTALFNSNSFAVSSAAPSLGDLLLNVVMTLILSVALIEPIFRQINQGFQKNKFYQIVAISGIILISFSSLFLYYRLLNQIYTGSQYLLDLNMNLSQIDPSFKITALSIFILASITYFIYFNEVKLSLEKQLLKFQNNLVYFLIFIVAVSAFFYYFLKLPLTILLLHVAFSFIAIFFKLPISFKYYQNKTTIYIALTAFICAIIGTEVDNTQHKKNDFLKKQAFGKTILEENDTMGELLIQIANESIKNSTEIKHLLSKNPIPFDKIDFIIKNIHLKNWFDSYNINIQYYNQFGDNIKNTYGMNFKNIWRNYCLSGQKTIIENLYLVDSVEKQNSKKYVNLINLKLENGKIFSIIISFEGINNNANSFYNSLLTNKTTETGSNYHYYVFDKKSNNSNLIGKNALDIIPNELLNSNAVNTKPIAIKNNIYVGYSGQKDKSIIVYSNAASFIDYYRNFSFLFILLIGALILVLAVVSIKYMNINTNQSFSSKIQIYLGLTLLLPLFITISLLIKTIDKSNSKNEIEKINSIALNLRQIILDENQKIPIIAANKYFWNDEILKLSHNFGVDINLYSANGALIATSNEGALSKKLIDRKLTEQELNKTLNMSVSNNLETKKIQDKPYFTNYSKIQNSNSIINGFIALPFQIPNSFKNQETNELIGSILSIFTTIFILLLMASIIISKNLTKPLNLITKYLQNTNLEKVNKPIEWESNDELGLLVKEYNKMIEKIEEGKKNISQNEKQLAWQDIAKQVAHEIKNPLTPMKLTLQHLQNILKSKNEIKNEQFEKSISNLIFNVNNVVDIVDSFSTFARMPLPKIKKTDLLKSFFATYMLHNTEDNIKISVQNNIKKAMILGDEKLLSQIFTNLIINALQSKKSGQELEILMEISKKNNQYLISFSDNGIGIDEELKTKIFMPNFSTKTEGTGVGLSMAKWGIENMNGKIWFESNLNCGTTFFIELPMA